MGKPSNAILATHRGALIEVEGSKTRYGMFEVFGGLRTLENILDHNSCRHI